MQKEKRKSLLGLGAGAFLFLWADYYDLGTAVEVVAYMNAVAGIAGYSIQYAKAHLAGLYVNKHLRINP